MKTVLIAAAALIVGLLVGWHAAGWAYRASYPTTGDAIAYDALHTYSLLAGKGGGLASAEETQSRVLSGFPMDLSNSASMYTDMKPVNRKQIDQMAAHLVPGESPLVRAKLGDISLECIRAGQGDPKKVDDCRLKAFADYQAPNEQAMASRGPPPQPPSD